MQTVHLSDLVAAHTEATTEWDDIYPQTREIPTLADFTDSGDTEYEEALLSEYGYDEFDAALESLEEEGLV